MKRSTQRLIKAIEDIHTVKTAEVAPTSDSTDDIRLEVEIKHDSNIMWTFDHLNNESVHFKPGEDRIVFVGTFYGTQYHVEVNY